MTESDNVYVAGLPQGLTEDALKTIFGAYGTISQCRCVPGQPKANALIRFGSVDEAKWIVENLNGNIAQGLTEPIQVRFADTPESKAQKWAGGGGWGGDKGDKGAKGGGKGYSPYDGGKGKMDQMMMMMMMMKGGKGGKGKGGKGGKGGARGLIAALQQSGVWGKAKYENDENTLHVSGLPYDTTDLDLYKIFAPFGGLAPLGVRAMQHEDGSCKGFGFVNCNDAQTAQSALMALNGLQTQDGTTITVSIKREFAGKNGGKDGGGKGKQ